MPTFDNIGGIALVEDDTIGTAASAAILGEVTHTLTRWVREGRIAASRAGDHQRAQLRFRRDDVVALADRLGTVPRSGRQSPRRSPQRSAQGPADDRLIGTVEAARILGVTRATVLNWAGRGVFPSIRFQVDGRTSVWRFQRGDFEAYVERSRVRPDEVGTNGSEPSGG